jgi:hypothetical protein
VCGLAKGGIAVNLNAFMLHLRVELDLIDQVIVMMEQLQALHSANEGRLSEWFEEEAKAFGACESNGSQDRFRRQRKLPL